MSTDREFFDFTVDHLLKQNEQSVDDTEGCVYRGPRGLMCSIGCIISDANYNEDLEGKSCHNSDVKRAVTNSIGFLPNFSLMNTLRAIHDEHTTDEWEYELFLCEQQYFVPKVITEYDGEE